MQETQKYSKRNKLAWWKPHTHTQNAYLH